MIEIRVQICLVQINLGLFNIKVPNRCKTIPNPRPAAFHLAGIAGGVGPEKAGRLLDAFGSVETVISASRGELQSVYGIGKGLADRIRWVVGE